MKRGRKVMFGLCQTLMQRLWRESLPQTTLFSDLAQRLDEDFWRLVGNVR